MAKDQRKRLANTQHIKVRLIINYSIRGKGYSLKNILFPIFLLPYANCVQSCEDFLNHRPRRKRLHKYVFLIDFFFNSIFLEPIHIHIHALMSGFARQAWYYFVTTFKNKNYVHHRKKSMDP